MRIFTHFADVISLPVIRGKYIFIDLDYFYCRHICFKIKDGVNYEPEDPNYDLFKLSMQVACKRLFPNFSFQDSSFNKQYGTEEVAYMGCRTRVIGNVNGPEVTDGRGNLAFTTINLPRLGILAEGDLVKFSS